MINSIRIFLLLFLFPSLLFAQYSDWEAEQFKTPVKKEVYKSYAATKVDGEVIKGDLVYIEKSYYSIKGHLIKTEGYNIQTSDTTSTHYFYKEDKITYTKLYRKFSGMEEGEISYEFITEWDENGAPKVKKTSDNGIVELGLIPINVDFTTKIIYQDNQKVSQQQTADGFSSFFEIKYDKFGRVSESSTVVTTDDESTTYLNIFTYLPKNDKNWKTRILDSESWQTYVERELISYTKQELKMTNNTPQHSFSTIEIPNLKISKMLSKTEYAQDQEELYWLYMSCVSIANDYEKNKGYSVENIFTDTFESIDEYGHFQLMPPLGDLMFSFSDKIEIPLMGKAYGSYYKYQGYFNLKQYDSALVYLDKFILWKEELANKYPNGWFGRTIETGYKLAINSAIINYEVGKVEDAKKIMETWSDIISLDGYEFGYKAASSFAATAVHIQEYELANKKYTELKAYVEKEYGKDSNYYKEVVMNLIAVKKKLVDQ